MLWYINFLILVYWSALHDGSIKIFFLNVKKNIKSTKNILSVLGLTVKPHSITLGLVAISDPIALSLAAESNPIVALGLVVKLEPNTIGLLGLGPKPDPKALKYF